MSKRRILVVDDDADVLSGLTALLLHAGWATVTASTGKEAIERFNESSPDVVLLDVMLPDMSGLEVLTAIRSQSESVAVVMMSGVGTIEMAVSAMKMGAETFLPKPFDYDNLEIVLDQAMALVNQRRRLEALRRSDSKRRTSFVGASDAVEKITDFVDRIADTASPVLIDGESGVGKGVIARMIHEQSARRDNPFVDLNCAALSRELLESELFGHEKGAFTDASASKPGLFEIAAGGTMFLDEIGELDIALQSKLLKAIEDRRFRRVGGVRDMSVDFRLVAATNRDLRTEVREGRFREDLFFRLDVLRITIPPLRDRRDDIPLLVETILGQLARELKIASPSISSRAMERLRSHDWPGNVRELRNVLERTLLTRRRDELLVEDMDIQEAASPAAAANGDDEIRPLETVIGEYIRNAVEKCDGNRREAARRLGISPSTLYARLQKKD